MAYKYTIDGVDLETIGVIVMSGSDDFLKMPDLKPPLQYDWKDQNGIQVYLNSPVYQSKEITLKMAIHATSESQFWERYNAFFNLIKTAGTKRLYVGELKRSFYVYYSRMEEFKRLTRLDLTDMPAGTVIASTYDLIFTEPIPSFLKSFAFLTKKNGGYLLTTNSENLINT